MVDILPLSSLVLKKAAKHRLQKKLSKQALQLSKDPSYPSLHVELLEPKENGVYSFRLDLKYRGLFIFRDDVNSIEILTITKHYEK